MGWFNKKSEREIELEKYKNKIEEKLNEHFGQNNLRNWNIWEEDFTNKFNIDFYWTTEKLKDEEIFKLNYQFILEENLGDEELNEVLEKMVEWLMNTSKLSKKINKKPIYEDEFMDFLYSKYKNEFINFKLKTTKTH